MDRAKHLEAVLAIVVGLTILYLVAHSRPLIIAAAVVGLIALFSDFLSGKIAWFWLKLSELLGFVSSRVILTVVYYLFLVPIALLSRTFNKGGLQLQGRSDTYYITRDHTFSGEDLENPW